MKKKRIIKKSRIDFPLLITVLLLVFIGIVMVFSSSWPEGIKDHNDGYYFVKRQIAFAMIGFVTMILVSQINYKIYEKYASQIFLLTLSTVILLLYTPLGQDFGMGARRWVSLGLVTFMPGDVIKIGAIIFFARTLSNTGDKITNFKEGVLPALVVIIIGVGSIIIQSDLGTSITLAATLGIMLIIAGLQLRYIVGAGAMGLVGISYLFLHVINNPKYANSFRIKRITSFLDPFADAQGSGWQVVQSLYALGSGGLFGLGLGKSKQKFFYIPESYNDFIYAIIGEEVGLIGASLVILLYIIILIRGVKIALKTKDSYGFYLSIGITALVSIQTIIHIAVVTSSIPTTGITLPFISYGGTSLLIYMGAMGILLSISKYGNRSE